MLTYRNGEGASLGRMEEDGVEYRSIPMQVNRLAFVRQLRDLLRAESIGVVHACLNSAQSYALTARCWCSADSFRRIISIRRVRLARGSTGEIA